MKTVLPFVALAAALLLAHPARGAAHYAVATWSDNSVHLLDHNLNDLSSFVVPDDRPNGVAYDGSLIYTVHFSTESVWAFDMDGNPQFSWTDGSLHGAQGLEMVDGKLAISSSGYVHFFEPATGNPLYSIPSSGGSVEGLAYDGTVLWQLTSAIVGINPLDGSVLATLPNPAVGHAFNGTGIDYSGPNELTVVANDGDWYKISSIDGSILQTGNNQLTMYGIASIPEPSSFVLLAMAGLSLVAVGRRLRRPA